MAKPNQNPKHNNNKIIIPTAGEDVEQLKLLYIDGKNPKGRAIL